MVLYGHPYGRLWPSRPRSEGSFPLPAPYERKPRYGQSGRGFVLFSRVGRQARSGHNLRVSFTALRDSLFDQVGHVGCFDRNDSF